MEQSIKTEQGTIYYTVKDERVTITTYHGNDAEVCVPARINGLNVTKIGKKAFMNSRQLQRVSLPDSVKKLGEWAFAYCPLLDVVELPKRKLVMGTGVFLGDKQLSHIVLRSREKDRGKDTDWWSACTGSHREDTAVLLAALPAMESGEYLLDMKEAGKAEWFRAWDACLLKLLDEPDEKGYTDMILCGEEDLNCSLDIFVREKRKKKVRYCFLRLLKDSELSSDARQVLNDYLMSHIVGKASMETWLVLKEEKGHLKEYYELYVRLGGLTEENYDATLADLGEKQPEMKAYFMRQHEEIKSGVNSDAFNRFQL